MSFLVRDFDALDNLFLKRVERKKVGPKSPANGEGSDKIDLSDSPPYGGHIRPTDNIRMRSRGFMPLCGQTTPDGSVRSPVRAEP